MTKRRRFFLMFLIGYLFFCLMMMALTVINLIWLKNSVITTINEYASLLSHLIGVGLAIYIFNVGSKYNKWFYVLGLFVFVLNGFFLVEDLVKYKWVIKLYHQISQLFV